MSIVINHLAFHYPSQNNKPILHIPSWSVSRGEQVYINGTSGSGKSTLLNIISGLLTINEGQVKVLGHQLDTMSSRQRDQFRANSIGYVFQQFNLIPYLNAIDNILLAHQFSNKNHSAHLREEIEGLLNALNINQTEWLKPTRQLSIGQQQRVSIARALINKPELLIADEPTSSLDAKNRDRFMSTLMTLVNEHKMTLVCVSHDESIAHYFTRTESLSDFNQVAL